LFLALSGVAGVGCAEAPAGSPPGAPSASAPTAVPTAADASFALVEPSELVAAPALAPLPPEPPQGGWALEVLEAALVQGDEGPITIRVTNASTSSTRIEDLELRFPSGYEVRGDPISLPPGWEVRDVDDARIELRAR